MSKTKVICERNLEATDAIALVCNRYPDVKSYHGTRYVSYGPHWISCGINNASLTSLFNLKRICAEAKKAVERYNQNPEQKYRLDIYSYAAPASLKAALKAGIITGTPAKKERVNKRYVNMDDPNDVITIDRVERRKAVYRARTDVDYNAVIEQLNKAIRGTLEAYNV